jgi:hypothetical protein
LPMAATECGEGVDVEPRITMISRHPRRLRLRFAPPSGNLAGRPPVGYVVTLPPKEQR